MTAWELGVIFSKPFSVAAYSIPGKQAGTARVKRDAVPVPEAFGETSPASLGFTSFTSVSGGLVHNRNPGLPLCDQNSVTSSPQSWTEPVLISSLAAVQGENNGALSLQQGWVPNTCPGHPHCSSWERHHSRLSSSASFSSHLGSSLAPQET